MTEEVEQWDHKGQEGPQGNMYNPFKSCRYFSAWTRHCLSDMAFPRVNENEANTKIQSRYYVPDKLRTSYVYSEIFLICYSIFLAAVWTGLSLDTRITI